MEGLLPLTNRHHNPILERCRRVPRVRLRVVRPFDAHSPVARCCAVAERPGLEHADRTTRTCEVRGHGFLECFLGLEIGFSVHGSGFLRLLPR
jgi:hypothetical protein